LEAEVKRLEKEIERYKIDMKKSNEENLQKKIELDNLIKSVNAIEVPGGKYIIA
jgi:hypothetical protein